MGHCFYQQIVVSFLSKSLLVHDINAVLWRKIGVITHGRASLPSFLLYRNRDPHPVPKTIYFDEEAMQVSSTGTVPRSNVSGI